MQFNRNDTHKNFFLYHKSCLPETFVSSYEREKWHPRISILLAAHCNGKDTLSEILSISIKGHNLEYLKAYKIYLLSYLVVEHEEFHI